jgi:hypothetical protein
MLYYIIYRLLLLIFNYKSIYDSFDLSVIGKTLLLILTMTPTIVDFLDGKMIKTK